MRVRTLFALASVFTAATAAGAACGTFDASEVPAVGNDAAADATSLADGEIADVPVSPDGGGGFCEVLTGTGWTTAAASVLAMAADTANVYWSDSGGVFRSSAMTPGGAADRVGTEAATHIVVGASFVAWRAQDGSIRVRPKNDLDVDASAPTAVIATSALAPRGTDSFFVRRPDSVITCTLTSCTQSLDKGGVKGIALAGSGYDYIAGSGGGAGIFNCPSGCMSSTPGKLLATASLSSTEIANDSDTVFWVDFTPGSVRKVARIGGAAVDVITGLVAPRAFFIDASERIVVATEASGIFRGPKTGCVAPAVQGPVVGASALAANTAWYAEGKEIKRVAP